MRKHLITAAFLLCSIAAQVFSACPDFTDLHSPYVTAYTGWTHDPFMSSGVVSGRHTLITQQGTDPNTGGALQLLPEGESQVIRLGNQQVGAEAEALVYRFTVDIDNAVLLLKFAVVLEDPGHDIMGQPRFTVLVTDSDGNLTEECAEYDVRASGDIPGFQTYQGNRWLAVRWRDWTNVGIDLSRYIGQEVQVQFITYDCKYSGHFGYAYFTASCMPNLLQLTECGTPFELSAPDGFDSYLWDNGEQTRTTIRTETNGNVWCNVTSVTGCQFTLSGYVTTEPVTTPDFIQATICEGESYNENYFNLPPQNAGVHRYYNTFFNPTTCAEQTTELELTVLQRYNQIKAAICHGEDYTENGFDIIQPAVGVRRDTILIGQISGCDYYNVLELTVNVSLEMPNDLVGDTSPCSNELATYAFAGSEMLTRFTWEFPENAVVTRGRYSPQVTLYFTDDTPGQVILKGENGCGTGATPLLVHPRQTHNIQLNDQVCQGSEYNDYGFNLGVQDSVGYFVYSKHLTSSLGCDSIVTFALNVLPTPVVRIEPKDAVLCNAGDEITLWALTDDMEYANIPNEKDCIGVDYEQWYNTLTPADESDFDVSHAIVNTINSYMGTGGNVVIPSTINGNFIYAIAIHPMLNYFTNATEIILPPTMNGIGAKSFANNPTLTYVTIPKSVFDIMPDAFDNSPNVIIRCYENSFVHQFAIENQINFELIGDCDDDYLFINIYDCTLDYLWNTGSTEGFLTVNPTETTTYSVIVTTQSGCSASASQLVLANTNELIIINETICAGETYTGYGFNTATGGTYTTTIHEDNCDIDIEIRLSVRPPITKQIIGTVCAGERFTEHGFDFELHQEGIFRDTIRLISYTGCDSIVTFAITVLPAEEITLHDAVCQNLPYNKNGFALPAQTIAGEFTYMRTSKTPQGCDSTIILKLLVNPIITNIISDEVEYNEVYNKYNFHFPKVTRDTTATQHLTSSLGCDSTVVLNLKVLLNCVPKDTVIYAVICENETYFFENEHLNIAGTYTANLKTSLGCDNIVTLEITVLPTEEITLHDTICQYQPYNKKGFSLPAQNIVGEFTYMRISETPDGCDSTVILKLLVNPTITNIISDEVKRDSVYNKYNFHFSKVTQDTTATQLLTSSLGCDSTVVLNLKVLLNCVPKDTVIYAVICQNETYFFGNEHLNIAGIYIDSLKTSISCDSIVTLHLTVENLITVAITADKERVSPGHEVTLTAVASTDDAIFSWIEPKNINTQEYKVRLYKNREFIVEASNNVCPANIASKLIEVIYPTAITPHDKDGLNDDFLPELGCHMIIFNRYGQKVYEGTNGWDGKYRGSIADPGTYFYVIDLPDGEVKKGTIEVVKIK